MNSKPKGLALYNDEAVTKAEEALYEVGFYSGDEDMPKHYETTLARVGNQILPVIHSTNDDRETLGEIAKQLVIAGIPFRLITIK